jgi:hypothetical protein
VPDRGAGHCLGPEGNGVNLGEGGEGGPGPQGSKEDKQSCSARAEATWRRKKRNERVGRDEEFSL